MYQAIVFLPLIGAIIAGFFGRLIGARASEVITTRASSSSASSIQASCKPPGRSASTRSPQ
jgi:NADH:ubiquinone oxidoreductase subunit 5 (subunit L)/multisubunit Na+/H+ antiporter MnhA subunit